ncbi:DctP family TRAP transporter solute-binding subunit [Modestobacter versicolor]|uniref:Tripartite ATP-independent transporter DctP family solute receptor n=1 Tax=Modestobacter versicolor TaxID=429133 RepID=A0A323VH42_9ACTN|nr:DctP family TRAP transporter solute-binding subunit [Modestobacter versicolor]MBB3674709.1 tripartite ATP-independent transporter DctP family solute receptor [Modestobacter versicolor]PZA23230.1 tRNA modification GTPase [Modestobacter versicolor]
MKTRSRRQRTALALAMTVPVLLAAACGGSDDGGGDGGGGGSAGEEVEITLAHSYTDDQPQARCGAQVIADEVASADVGVTVEIFGASQLGGDADRVNAVAAGDHDMDIQGASALGAIYEPIGVVDAAYAFDDAEHLATFFGGDASATVRQDFADSTGVQILGAWSAGARHFTASEPIREPADLDGLRMRFPNSPQYLMNAEALGATPTEVAFEELYLALQQGIVDGQENPITNIAAQNYAEVQDYLSLSAHQQNSNLVVIGPVWDELSEEQQEALSAAVDAAVEQVPQCVEELEQTQLDEWASGGDFEVVDDVDVDAFREQAEDYFSENYSGDQLAVYEAIRGSAE